MANLFTAAHFSTLLLLGVVISLVILEWRLYGQHITPIFLIAMPYTLLVVAINFFAIHFGYFTISTKANLLVMLFFILFFLIGLLIRKLFPKGSKVEKTQPVLMDIWTADYEGFYRLIGALAIIAGILQFRQAVGQIGLINMGTPKFKELISSGLLSHMMLLSRPVFFFLFASIMTRWGKINFLLLLFIFLMVIVPQVKYQIIILVVTSVIYGINLGVIKVTFRKTVFSVLIVYFLFNITYVIGFSASGLDFAYSEKVQAFLFNHFFTYLFGGPIGFSEILEMKQYPSMTIVELLAVVTNVYKAILGDSQYVKIIIRHWIPISTITQYFHGTNTFGLFGMLYAYAGVAGAGIFTMLYAALSYTIFQLALTKRDNMAYQMAYAYIGAYLVLSFFGLYWNMLPFYESLAYILILQFIAKSMKNVNKLRLEHFGRLLSGDSGSTRSV